MSFHYKALLLVVVLYTIMFMAAKPLFVTFMSREDYAVRRNVWLALTLSAFLLPNFWLFMVVAAVLMLWAARKDSNPIALYLFLVLSVPPIREYLEGFGVVRYIMAVDHLRLLSLFVLLPLALKSVGKRREDDELSGQPVKGLAGVNVLLLGYLLLQFALRVPYASFTANLRGLTELTIDTIVPYFVIVYFIRSKASLAEVMAAFCLSVIVIAPLTFFEFAKGWILYQGIEDRWGTAQMISYLTRGEFLRAQVTAGHSIVLGYGIAMAFSFWLYLQTRLPNSTWRWLGTLAIVGGLASTLARGPWIGALLAFLVYQALGPDATRRTLKNLVLLALIAGAVLLSPYADKIIQFLPFAGSVNTETIDYRRRLAEVSWLLVQQNPFFGTPFYMSYMEDLRQGQGIIDIVNTYAGVALGSGLVGLALFAGFFAVLALKGLRVVRATAQVDGDFSLLGASLVSSLVGAMLTIATCSFYLSIPTIQYAVAAMIAAYVRLSTVALASSAPVGHPNFDASMVARPSHTF